MRNSFSFLTLFIGLFLGIAISIWSFSEPGENPPNCTLSTPGCNEPLNAGVVRQNKNGGEVGMLNLQLGMQSDGSQAEGDIVKLDELRGAGDLRMYSTGIGNPIYLEGDSVVINNDAGTGNVGIGLSNPAARLEILSPGGAPSKILRLRRTTPGSVDFFSATSNTVDDGTGKCQADGGPNAVCLAHWRIDTGDSIGCSTATPISGGRALCADLGD